jgi:hypothetical protein
MHFFLPSQSILPDIDWAAAIEHHELDPSFHPEKNVASFRFVRLFFVFFTLTGWDLN